MKWLWTVILLLMWNLCDAQVLTQVYVDPCNGQVLTVTVPINNGTVTIVYRGQSKVVTANDITSGALTVWINMVNSTPCPQTTTTTVVITQAVTQAVAQATQQATQQATAQATQAATAAATSSATTSAASAATSSAVSSTPAPAASSSHFGPTFPSGLQWLGSSGWQRLRLACE